MELNLKHKHLDTTLENAIVENLDLTYNNKYTLHNIKDILEHDLSVINKLIEHRDDITQLAYDRNIDQLTVDINKRETIMKLMENKVIGPVIAEQENVIDEPLHVKEKKLQNIVAYDDVLPQYLKQLSLNKPGKNENHSIFSDEKNKIELLNFYRKQVCTCCRRKNTNYRYNISINDVSDRSDISEGEDVSDSDYSINESSMERYEQDLRQNYPFLFQ